MPDDRSWEDPEEGFYDRPAPRARRDDDLREPQRRRPRRRRRRYEDEDDEDYRRARPDGLPVLGVVGGIGLTASGALGLLGNGAIFCVGFYEEFLSGRQPDPAGVVALTLFGLAILASLVAIAGGLSLLFRRLFWLAIVSCVAAALSTHFLMIGVAAGIVALIALLQPDVKEAFR
jgi:hypothetical protein